MSTKYLLKSVFCLLILGLVAGMQIPEKEQRESKPNILFIFTDDQGYHDVSYYGTQDIRTPNIDNIASSGMPK